MELKLVRTDENKYELHFKKMTLGKYDTFSQGMERGEAFAKNFRKKLFVSQACISDWYVGFPENDQSPVVFYDTRLVNASAIPDRFKFVEGPFFTDDEACTAALKISGKKAIKEE